MGREINVEILFEIAPKDVLIRSPRLFFLFHSNIKCPGAFHEHQNYFCEVACERDLHGQVVNSFHKILLLLKVSGDLAVSLSF